ncbi:MAG: hypothetical protein KGQ67_08700 [Betaproteobacteria bacterium]|nr:hypothetical protein [Betaproteobacteria bacterium]
MRPEAAPDTSGPRRGFAALALLVLLAWAQLLWPFLHAHQGQPLVTGWHLHLGPAAVTARPAMAEPLLAASPALSLAARHPPHGPESAEIGPGAGLPGGRGLPAGADSALAPFRVLPAPSDRIAAATLARLAGPTGPVARRHHAAGLPAQPHAPPAARV